MVLNLLLGSFLERPRLWTNWISIGKSVNVKRKTFNKRPNVTLSRSENGVDISYTIRRNIENQAKFLENWNHSDLGLEQEEEKLVWTILSDKVP